MAYFPRTRARAWRGPRLLPMIYVIVGVVVAAGHRYLAHVDTVRQGVSAALAVVLWPLLYLGVNLHIH